MLDGVEVVESGTKDEISISGNDIDNVSQSAANIQCVRDRFGSLWLIRAANPALSRTRISLRRRRLRRPLTRAGKFLDGIYVSSKETVVQDEA